MRSFQLRINFRHFAWDLTSQEIFHFLLKIEIGRFQITNFLFVLRIRTQKKPALLRASFFFKYEYSLNILGHSASFFELFSS